MPRGGWRHHSHALPPAEKKEHRRQPPSVDPHHQLRPSDTHRISRCGRPLPPPWEAGSARGRGGAADLDLKRGGAGDAGAIAAGVVGVAEGPSEPDVVFFTGERCHCQISSFCGFLGMDKRWWRV